VVCSTLQNIIFEENNHFYLTSPLYYLHVKIEKRPSETFQYAKQNIKAVNLSSMSTYYQ
jgi:hypothetical protein